MGAVVLTFALLCWAGTAEADRPANAGGASATATNDGVLERGDRGTDVERLQGALGVGADGVFGPVTERAVKRFQRRNGLVVDGVVGAQTRQALGLRPFSSSRATTGRSVDVPSALDAIARCESGGDPTAVSPGGTYRGKYQFSRETWRGLGGRGDPAAAPESVQDRMALKLYRQRGSAPWPSCG